MQAAIGRGMRWELGTLLECHSLGLGLCLQLKIFHTALAVFAWSYHWINQAGPSAVRISSPVVMGEVLHVLLVF